MREVERAARGARCAVRDDAPTMTDAAQPRTADHPASRTTSLLLVTGLLLVACSMRSPITGVGAVLGPISADVGLGPSTAGVLTSLPLVAFAVASAVVPRVAGRLGVVPALVSALVLLALGAGLRWVPGAVPLFAGTLAIGVAIAVTNVLLPVVVRMRFPARVALVTSGYVVLMQVAGSIASGLTVPAADHLAGGWRTALALWGLPAVLAALCWAPLLRGGRERPVAGATRAPTPWRSPLAWAVTAFMGAQSVVFYSLLTWLPTVLADRSGLDAARGGWVLALLQAAGVAAGLLVPLLAGRTVARTRRVMVGVSLCSVLGVLALLALPGVPAVGAVGVGLGTGGAIVLALAAMSARAADAEGAVALSGMAQSGGYLAAALGPVVVGAVHAASGSWTVPLLLVALAGAVQVVAASGAGRDAVVQVP